MMSVRSCFRTERPGYSRVLSLPDRQQLVIDERLRSAHLRCIWCAALGVLVLSTCEQRVLLTERALFCADFHSSCSAALASCFPRARSSRRTVVEPALRGLSTIAREKKNQRKYCVTNPDSCPVPHVPKRVMASSIDGRQHRRAPTPTHPYTHKHMHARTNTHNQVELLHCPWGSSIRKRDASKGRRGVMGTIADAIPPKVRWVSVSDTGGRHLLTFIYIRCCVFFFCVICCRG